MEYVEFLEFICRISEIPDLYITETGVDLKLHEKIDKTLNAISLSLL